MQLTGAFVEYYEYLIGTFFIAVNGRLVEKVKLYLLLR